MINVFNPVNCTSIWTHIGIIASDKVSSTMLTGKANMHREFNFMSTVHENHKIAENVLGVSKLIQQTSMLISLDIPQKTHFFKNTTEIKKKSTSISCCYYIVMVYNNP